MSFERITKLLRNPYLSLSLRWALGAVLVYAGWSKVFDMAGLADAVERYRILPTATVNLVAIVLPPLELVAGFCLMFGLLLEGALSLATVMFVVFLVVIESAILRGLDIECGCFGTSNAEKVGIQLLIRDALLLLAVVPIWMTQGHRWAIDSFFKKAKETEFSCSSSEPSSPHV